MNTTSIFQESSSTVEVPTPLPQSPERKIDQTNKNRLFLHNMKNCFSFSLFVILHLHFLLFLFVGTLLSQSNLTVIRPSWRSQSQFLPAATALLWSRQERQHIISTDHALPPLLLLCRRPSFTRKRLNVRWTMYCYRLRTTTHHHHHCYRVSPKPGPKLAQTTSWQYW